MDVWITECKRRATCTYCGKTIPAHTHMVVCQYWLKIDKRENGGRSFRKKMYFHIKDENGIHCWEANGIAAAERKPKPVPRGRPMIQVAPENRAIRSKILNQRSTIIQRIRNEVDGTGMGEGTDPPNFERIEHLGIMLEKLKVKIADYGGAPKNW